MESQKRGAVKCFAFFPSTKIEPEENGMKKAILWQIAPTIIMLVVPWLAVALVNGSNVIRVAVQNKVCIVQWKIDTRRLPL